MTNKIYNSIGGMKMTAYKDMTKEQLMQEKSELVKKYEEIKG